MTRTGLEVALAKLPNGLKNKKLGILCHAASITSRFRHAADAFASRSDCHLKAIFGPQHGLWGQTQANMVEWESSPTHPVLGIPVHSLYGRTRKPTAAMLDGLEAFVVDLQDVGARPYTYIWTVKLCMQACADAGIPVWVLDRPNPIAAIGFDGPLLSPSHFSFVGGAAIPLCHRMTMAEMALLVKRQFVPSVELHCVAMAGWARSTLWQDTGLPWVLPSPNMPTPDTAAVYPGMVLFEATNLSEGRGTTRPFEFFGAPYLDARRFAEALPDLPGCLLREHGYIPTFDKWHGQYCTGWQTHVTNPRTFRPVMTATAIVAAALATASGQFRFSDPPYEYETVKMPFDILAGDETLRRQLVAGEKLSAIAEGWREEHRGFRSVLKSVALYPERLP
jgi:uncharacterized protein YbbC (DUF1343 family)